MDKKDQLNNEQILNTINVNELLTIEDECMDIEVLLEKALYLSGDLSLEFFKNYCEKKKEDHQKIIYAFSEFGIENEILYDYIIRIKHEVHNLTEKINYLRKK